MSFTLADFLLTCAVLGPRLVLAAGLGQGDWLIAFAIGASLVQCATGIARLVTLSRSPIHELRAAASLIRKELRAALIARFVCTALALALVPVSPTLAFVFALAGEGVGRYLFFAGVVPKSMASTYLTPKGAAA